jgi:biopolymer transport protein ExbB
VEVSLLEYFAKGGALMWVLLGMSVVAAAVIVERAAVYLWFGLRCDAWLARVRAMAADGRSAEALASARASRHPVARVVEAYLANLSRPAKLRRDAVVQAGSYALESVEARLRVLAAISHLAPLVGLLGTVTGMVAAFAQIQSLQGTVKPSDLAGGIWEALLTTVFGLMVAIPCMAAFHGFESHADRIARRMQLAVTGLDEALGVTDSGDPATPAPTPSEEWSTVG